MTFSSINFIDFILVGLVLIYFTIVYFVLSSYPLNNHENNQNNQNDNCEEQSFLIYSFTIQLLQSALTGSILSVIVLQLTKLFSHIYIGIATYGNSINIMKINIFLSIISASSGLILTLFGKGISFPDYFGVDIPWIFWLEWLITMPMLSFVIFLIQHKQTLSFSEIIVIISQTLQVVFGYCLHFTHLPSFFSLPLPFTSSSTASSSLLPVLFIFLCLCCIAVTFTMLIHSYLHLHESLHHSTTHLNLSSTSSSSTSSLLPSTSTLTDPSLIQYIKAKQIHALVCLYLIILSLYISTYLLTLFSILNNDLIPITSLLISFTSRILFNEYASNSYIEYFHGSKVKLLAANKADEERIAYLKYVFHEARVPLQSFTLGLQLFLDYKTSLNEKKEMLQVMKEASEFISNTFDDVLSIQQIETGALLLKFESFNFKKSLKSLVTSLMNPISSKQLEFIVEITPHLPSLLFGDGFRLTHVIANFLSNSIKFSPIHSKLILRVTCQIYNVSSRLTSFHRSTSSTTSSKTSIRSPSSSSFPSSSTSTSSPSSFDLSTVLENSNQNCKLTVEVIDHGMGISEADQLNLFQPYMQVNPEKNQGGRGTGIGLTLCKQIITMHGGELICRSKPGAGSTFGFTLTLPVIDSTPWDHNEDNSSQSDYYLNDSFQSQYNNHNHNSSSLGLSERQRSTLQSSSYHILVVDDSVSNRRLLQKLLHFQGITSDGIDNGRRAIELITQNISYYDFILLDRMMPGMSGIDTAMSLRRLGYNNLIIGITGCAFDDERLTFLNAGIDCILTKPINITLFNLLLQFTYFNGIQSRYKQQEILHFNDSQTIQWIKLSSIANQFN